MINLSDSREDVLFRYFSGNASDSEIKELSEWLDENLSNRHYFASLKNIYIEIKAGLNPDYSQHEKAFNKFMDRISMHEKSEKSDRKSKSIRFRNNFQRYAALVLLVVSVAAASFFLGYRNFSQISNKMCEIAVPYGGKSAVILPDGSRVWLNAGSTFRYNRHFGIDSREVYLEGEAYFNVEKSKNPFIVHTAFLDIRALGTAFNVKSYPDEDKIETTLVEGTINVRQLASNKSIVLQPNEKLTFHKHIPKNEVDEDVNPSIRQKEKITGRQEQNAVMPVEDMNIKENVNTVESTSWKDGDLIINKETLEELTRKLERKYDIIFEFENNELKKYTYSGTLKDFPLEQVLKALQLTSPVICTINEKTVYLNLNRKFNRLKYSQN